MINYIIGGAKSGKTSFCIDEALKKQENMENSIIIVPEQSTLQVESKLIEKTKNSSIMNVQVYSFQRLAHKIFLETGLDNKVYIEDIGKLMLIRLILNKNKSNLQFYNRGFNKNGFIESITQTLGELTQYNVTIEDLEKIISRDNISKSLKLKLSDIKLIYNDYNTFIKDKYISTSETLDVLSEKIQFSEYIKTTNIFVDGFSGLTSQEYKIISRLANFSKSITITFEIKGKDKIYSKLDPYFEPKKMKNNITEIVKSYGLEINEEIYLNSIKRNNEELDFLKENYFNKNNKYQQEVNNIKIFTYKNKYEEVEGVASNIINIVKEGYSYSDISIVVGDINTYQSIVTGVFSNFNIPVFVDKKSDVMNNSLTEIIRGIIQVFVSNYSYQAIFKVLKNELCNISMEEVEVFENYILEYGISGYRWNMDSWEYGIKNSNYDLDEIKSIRDKVNHLFSYFISDLKKDKKYTVKFLIEKIVEFLVSNGIYEKLMELEQISNNENKRKEAKEYSQIWDKYMGLFDKVVDVLGKEEVSVKDFAGILESGIKGLSLGMIPTYQNQVVLGDFTRSKIPDSKIVFLVGANDGQIPIISKENSILCDSDKIALLNEGITLTSTTSDFNLSQQLEIYNILVVSSDKLYITYPMATIDGSKLKASQVIYKLLNIFSKLKIEEQEDIITFAKPMLNRLVSILVKEKNKEYINETEAIILEFFSNGEYKNLVNELKLIINGKDGEKNLSQPIIDKIYGKEILTSISKLERYANCPYSYFIEYNLKARERKLYELGHLDLGNLFHEILDRFSKIIDSRNLIWENLEEDEISLIVDEIVEKLESEEGSIFKSSSRYKHYLTRATVISKKSIFALAMQLKSGSFKVIGSEVDFGIKDKISTIIVDVGDEKFLKLTGKVDRIDVMDKDGIRFVKIIDYKSGKKKFEEQDVYDGVQLQLLTYLNAILENGSKILKDKMIYEYLPGGVFYFNIQNPKFEVGEIDKDSYKKALLKKFKLSGIMTSDKEVIKGMDNNIESVEDSLVGDSDIIPISFNKDGKLSSNSRNNALESEAFENLLEVTKNNVEKIGKEIFGGKISVAPLKNKKNNACTYCQYGSICEIEILK